MFSNTHLSSLHSKLVDIINGSRKPVLVNYEMGRSIGSVTSQVIVDFYSSIAQKQFITQGEEVTALDCVVELFDESHLLEC